jgi:hypothetical protein
MGLISDAGFRRTSRVVKTLTPFGGEAAEDPWLDHTASTPSTASNYSIVFSA